jgi:hypothetical protein
LADVLDLLLDGAFSLGVPLYLVLQVWLPLRWAGGWRIAALAPLVAIAPAVAWSLLALAHGSNLWPLTVILLAPVAFAYLVILCAARALGR